MSAPWVIACVEAAILAAIAVSHWCRTGRKVIALSELPPPPAVISPSPAEVAVLVKVLTVASKPGAGMADIAMAVLDAGYRRQRGGAR